MTDNIMLDDQAYTGLTNGRPRAMAPARRPSSRRKFLAIMALKRGIGPFLAQF